MAYLHMWLCVYGLPAHVVVFMCMFEVTRKTLKCCSVFAHDIIKYQQDFIVLLILYTLVDPVVLCYGLWTHNHIICRCFIKLN